MAVTMAERPVQPRVGAHKILGECSHVIWINICKVHPSGEVLQLTAWSLSMRGSRSSGMQHHKEMFQYAENSQHSLPPFVFLLWAPLNLISYQDSSPTNFLTPLITKLCSQRWLCLRRNQARWWGHRQLDSPLGEKSCLFLFWGLQWWEDMLIGTYWVQPRTRCYMHSFYIYYMSMGQAWRQALGRRWWDSLQPLYFCYAQE